MNLAIWLDLVDTIYTRFYRARLKGGHLCVVNFVIALAYHFYLTLPAAVTQPGDLLLAVPCTSHQRVIGIGIPRQNESQLLLEEGRLGAGVHYSVVVVIRSQYQIVSIHRTSSRKAEERKWYSCS